MYMYISFQLKGILLILAPPENSYELRQDEQMEQTLSEHTL